jgi:hypothetical protein
MHAHLPLSLLVAIAAGCGGGDAGDTCTSSADCGGDLFCRGPDEPQVCGIPPREDCAVDQDCGGGLVCHAIFDPCSADGQGSMCDVACDPGGCGDGLRCNAAGACEAISCAEDDRCASFESCDPAFDAATPVHARTDGCAAITCGPDAPCPGPTLCVNGRCQSGAGACREDIAVP